MAKSEGNVTEANKYFCSMLDNPEAPDYPELKLEKRLMVDVVKTDSELTSSFISPNGCENNCINSNSSCNKGEKVFLRNLFLSLTPQLQYKVLMSVTKESDSSWYDLCQLMLLTLKMFPTKIEEEGGKLVDLVLKAETSDTSQPKDLYQKLLVYEVFPLIFKSRLSFESVDVIKLYLMKTLQYYIDHSYIKSKVPSELASFDELDSKLCEVLQSLAKKLSWSRDIFPCREVSIESALNRISSFIESSEFKIPTTKEASDAPMDLSKPRKQTTQPVNPVIIEQVIFALFSLFIRSFNHYISEVTCNQVIFIERTCNSRPLNKSVIQTGNSTEIVTPNNRLKVAFVTCIKIIDMVIDIPHEQANNFFHLLKATQVDSAQSYVQFQADACIYKGRHEELMRQFMSIKPDLQTLSSKVQNISCCLLVYDHKTAINTVFSVVEIINQMPFDQGKSFYSVKLPTTITGKTYEFISSKPETLLDFCISSLIASLNHTTLLSLKPSDAGIGHLIVLSQYQWPKYIDIFNICIATIKPTDVIVTTKSVQPQVHKFTYLPFLDYIVHPDILEEFMAIASDERINLEIKPVQAASMKGTGKSMTTRGVNKGAKEEVRGCLISQMKKPNAKLTPALFIDFILNQLKPSYAMGGFPM